MDKSDYQMLRFSIEVAIHESRLDNNVSDADLTSNIMRLCIHSVGKSRCKSQKARKAFLTFRRDRNVVPPSWAYRKPGIDSRLPTL